MNEMTETQAKNLTLLLASIRGDWHPQGIIKSLQVAKDKGTAAEVAIAAIRAATNPKNRTPAIIPMDGEHWRPPTPKEPDRLPPRELWCPDHNLPESKCKPQHTRTPPPPGWKTWKADAA